MRDLLIGLLALPLLAGSAWASEPLNDTQMDRITAGDACSAGGAGNSCATVSTIFTCPSCTAGQVFVPISPQTFFTDFVRFLNVVDFKLQ